MRYAADMRQHFEVDNLVRTCVDTNMPELLKTVRSKVSWCDKIPERVMDLRLFGGGIWDARPIHEMCRKVRNVVELDFATTTAQVGHSICYECPHCPLSGSDASAWLAARSAGLPASWTWRSGSRRMRMTAMRVRLSCRRRLRCGTLL